MDIKYSDLVIEKLDTNHDLYGFNCGMKDINEFLQDDSLTQMVFRFNVTYVCNYNSEIIGYFTLCSDAIQFKNIEDDDKILLKTKDVDYPNLPALKLCRLGIHSEHQNKGIGTYLVSRVIRQALELSENIGIRFVTVDAYYMSGSWEFYRDKFLFKLFPKEENKINNVYKHRPNPKQSVAMYLDIHTI